MSLAKLKLDDPQCIDQIGDLIFDDEGNDWSVQSAALGALALLGGKSLAVIPRLLTLAEKTLEEEDFNGYPCTNRLLAEAFGAIGCTSPQVIEALRKIIEKQGYISTIPAISALSTLGAASLPALATIKKYLFWEGNEVDNSEKAAKMIQALTSIAGDAHPILAEYLEHLYNSPFEDVRALASNEQPTR
jgi:hypothetical protein